MISVCIATYNGGQYIAEQIASILPQLGDGDEIVVSDDASTDNTLETVRSFGDYRIRIVEGPQQHSPTLNFENAVRHAKGEYIFLADQDDVWMPSKVDVCMAALDDCDCVVSDAVMTDSMLRTTSQSLYATMHTRPGRLYNLLWHNGYTGCCMAFRRRILCHALPFPKDTPMHDIWLGNVAAWLYKVRFIDDRLVLFRRHDNAASCNGRGSRFSMAQQLRFRWNVVKNIVSLRIKASKH